MRSRDMTTGPRWCMAFLRSVCVTAAFVLNTCNQPTIVLNTYNQPTAVLQYVTVNDAVLSPIGGSALILFLVVSGGVVVSCVVQDVWCLEQAFWYSFSICSTDSTVASLLVLLSKGQILLNCQYCCRIGRPTMRSQTTLCPTVEARPSSTGATGARRARLARRTT